MIHVTITDLDNNEVKFDKDVNAVIIGTSDEGDGAAGVLGPIKELAFAYNVLMEAVDEATDDHPEFWAILRFINDMRDIENDDDADE